jgi:hypothetical protein
MNAVINSNESFIQLLLEKGASQFIKDYDGRTAYDLACRKKDTPMARFLKPHQNDHIFVPELIDIPIKIKARLDDLDSETLIEYKRKIASEYNPKIISAYSLKKENFDLEFYNAISKNDLDKIKGMTEPLGLEVFKIKFFSLDYCSKLLEELANFEKVAKNELGLTIKRPNSMNNYGLILDDIGFFSLIEELISSFVMPLCRVYFPDEKPFNFENHHSFIVSYKIGEDLDLANHIDDSDVTVNICLGKEFEGGQLTFYGTKPDGSPMSYSHEPGTAVIHLGKNWHEAQKITSGERTNLIIWCKCSNRRYLPPKIRHSF